MLRDTKVSTVQLKMVWKVGKMDEFGKSSLYFVPINKYQLVRWEKESCYFVLKLKSLIVVELFFFSQLDLPWILTGLILNFEF